MPGLLNYLNRGSSALVGSTGNYGGLLSDDEQKQANQQAQLALAAQLLDAGGYSPNRTSFGQALGRGISAAGQARQGSVDQALQAALLRKQMASAQSSPYGSIPVDKFTPESLQKYKTSGNFTDLVPVTEETKEHPDIARYKYFKSLPLEEQQQFLLTQRAPVTDRLTTVNGVQSFANPVTHNVTPLTSIDEESAARGQLAQSEAQGKAIGGATGEAEGSLQKKAINAQMIDSTLDIADPLIDLATGSGAGAAADKVVGFFGFAPSGAQATAQLQILQAGLMLNQPRMEGPQSDRDVELYRQAAASLGDPTVPRETKKAAVKTIREMQDKYREGAQQSKERTQSAPAKRPPLSSFKTK